MKVTASLLMVCIVIHCVGGDERKEPDRLPSLCLTGDHFPSAIWNHCIETEIRRAVKMEVVSNNLYVSVNVTWLCKQAEMTINNVFGRLSCPNISHSYSQPDYFNSLRAYLSEFNQQRKGLCNRHQGRYNETHHVCQHGRPKETSWKQFEKNSRNIRLIGNTASTLCLLLLIAIFGIFKDLRSFGGRNIMCLAAVLCLAQILQGVSGETSEQAHLCLGLAIGLHWLYLCAFCWMGCIAFDLCKAVASPFKVGRFSSGKSFLIYNCITVFSPSVIVISCVIAEFTTEGVIGYGNSRGVCFVHNYWSNLFSFVIPVSFLLIFNLICLLITLVKLYQHQRKSNVILSKRHTIQQQILNLAFMSLKACILVGIPWTLGFIGVLSNSTVILYAFVTLTACQGVFMFFLFCCNKRVYRLVQERLRSNIVDTTASKGDRESKDGQYRLKAIHSRAPLAKNIDKISFVEGQMTDICNQKIEV